MTRRPLRARCGAALLLSFTLVACSSGGRSSKSGVAPTSSAAPTTSSSTTPPPPLPSPGGTTAALATASTPVQATLALGHHAAFRERNSLSDLVTSSAPGLGSKAFLVEDKGFVRVLDLSGATPRLERAIALQAAALIPGQAMGALTIQDERTALLTSSGAGAEAIWLFDPTRAQGPADVQRLDVGQLSVTWPAGTLDSAGVDVGGRALPINFVSGAALAGGRLWFSSANFDASFNNQPGTVFLYDWNPTTRTASGGAVIRTSTWNPTGLTRILTPRGELLLVTSSGLFGAGPSVIDVIDPRAPAVVGKLDLGAVNANGRVVVSPDGRRGYLGDSTAARVHVLDLDGIGDLIGRSGVADLSARKLGAWELPAAGPSQYVSSIALSHTGRYLYAASFNESAVHVVDLAAPGIATIVRGFTRTGSAANFEGLSSLVAVRPGTPGVDFQGPSLLVGTINLSPTDRTITDVPVVLDAVTLDRH